MKKFIENGVEYSIKQKIGGGIQYRARYISDPVITEACVFLSGIRHTKQQVIEAIARVNEQAEEE